MFTSLSGMGDGTASVGTDPNDPTLPPSLASLIQTAITTYNSQRILDANIELAKLGRPPIDQSLIAPQYNVGLSPDVKNMLMIGGLGLLLVLLLSRR